MPASPPIGPPRFGAAATPAARAAAAICWRPRHCPIRRLPPPPPRPGGGGNRRAAEPLPDPPPPPPAAEGPPPPGAGTRNGEPLYAFPAKRIVHHLIAETPVRTSSLRGLGATPNGSAIDSARD